MNTLVASRILRMMDPRYRRNWFLIYIGLFAATFYVHVLANNWASPLALIPRTFTGIAMGQLLARIFALKKFPSIMEFFDRDKLLKTAQPIAAAEPAKDGRSADL